MHTTRKYLYHLSPALFAFFVFLGMIVGALCILRPKGALLSAPVTFDFPLTIIFQSAPAGRFRADTDGRGGLAALHSFVSDLRRQREAERGGVILLQGGNFTGSERAPDLQKKLLFPELNLLRYMKYDALSLSRKELEGLKKLTKDPMLQREFATAPLLAFNYRNMDRALPVRPYRILHLCGHPIFVSSLIAGSEPQIDTAPERRLVHELKRQSGLELALILLEGRSQTAHDDPDELQDPHLPKAYRPLSFLDSQEFTSLLSLPDSERPLPVSLPKRQQNRFSHSTLIFVADARENRFYRHESGPYICATRAEQLCRLDLILRNGQVIGLEQRFFSPNSKTQSQERIRPDLLLWKTLNRNRKNLTDK